MSVTATASSSGAHFSTGLPNAIILANAPAGVAPTLLEVVRDAARATTPNGASRSVYVLSCYFDEKSLGEVVGVLREVLSSAGGKVSGVTIVLDVGEWIRRRCSRKATSQRVAEAAGVSTKRVRVVPVDLEGRLLHAKAYAVIRRPLKPSTRNGFVAITSGNATERGLGLADNRNVELVTIATDVSSLGQFQDVIGDLLLHEVSPEKAAKNDEVLSALRLLSGGAFYHKSQGSLSGEVRFRLTLTRAGRKAYKTPAAFAGYTADSKTLSKDPLKLGEIFKQLPKPIPSTFWRLYSVDTLLGAWVPTPIAHFLDSRQADDVAPLVTLVQQRASGSSAEGVARKLRLEVKELRKSASIKEGPGVVAAWCERVERFSANRALIELRLQPYQRVPDVLDSANRGLLRETFSALRSQLTAKRRPVGVKRAVARYLDGELSAEQMDAEFNSLAESAASLLGMIT